MVAAFLVTTWSLQRVSQMQHKDMLYATYRLKIAICYRNKRHFLPERQVNIRVSHPNGKTK
jgi:hypothetical protein